MSVVPEEVPRGAVRDNPGSVHLRSLLFGIGQVLFTLLFVPFCLLAAPLPFPQRYRFISQWARFILWWLGLICGLRAEIRGLENLPERPCIVMSKHQSAWETLAMQGLFSPQVWVLKRELLWIPFFGWGLAMLRPIAIDRKSGRLAVRQVVKQGRRRLESGAWVVIFPEGTRIAPGKKGKYKVGGAILAEHTGYPILPIAHNAGEFWPRKSFLKHPGTIRMEIGPPIPSEGRNATEIIKDVEEWIEGTMGRISKVK